MLGEISLTTVYRQKGNIQIIRDNEDNSWKRNKKGFHNRAMELIYNGNRMLQLIEKRLTTALSTFPTTVNLLQLGLPLTGLAILLLLIGFKSGFLEVDVLQKSWEEITKIVIFSFIIPALSEEIVFRVLFLPHPTENPSIKTQLLWAAISLVAFIIYHPFQGLTWNPAGREVFMNPSFLILAALLGAMCTLAYLVVGSIWLPVIIHWLAVTLWLILLGGFAQFARL